MYLSQCDTVNGCGKTYPSDLECCPHCKTPQSFSALAAINPVDYAYDIETYPNIFTCCVVHLATGMSWRFEISDRINEIDQFVAFVQQLRDINARMIGYNNVGFDYPVVHYIVLNPWVTHVEIYNKAMSIINSREKFGHLIWESDRIVEQIDLYKVHHFDNPAKATSLKALEMAMRMDNVEDLPFEVGTELNDDEKEVLHTYNKHDVDATCRFYVRSLNAIQLRESLSNTFGRNFMNMSDVKMGEVILVTEIEKAGIPCYERVNGRRQPRQTYRHKIDLGQVIFDYVKFERPEFEAIRAHLASQVINETKGVFKGLIATVNGLEYKFGTGGLHASVDSEIFVTNETHQVVDVDVAGFYVDLAIQNKLYPEHLGEEFTPAYDGIKKQRAMYPKTNSINGAFKLAGNGAYGGSNNEYSPFFDSQYTMTVTINGQLMLCMLVEQMIKIPGLRMIQANTDGITYYCPHEYVEHSRAICRWWEQRTKLELEEALYSHMFVRDVNNYMAVYNVLEYLYNGEWVHEKELKKAEIKTDGLPYKPIHGLKGKIKRIGAYAYERADENPATREVPYHKDPSALIVPKTAEAVLVHGKDVETFIKEHKDPFDFMLRAKVPRSNQLVMRWPEYDVELKLPSIIRYFVSRNGGSLVKIAPASGEPGTWKRKNGISDSFYHKVLSELDAYSLDPTVEEDAAGIPHDERIHTKNKSKHDKRESSMCKGWLTTDCSDVKNFDWSAIDYDYYISEAKKLVDIYAL